MIFFALVLIADPLVSPRSMPASQAASQSESDFDVAPSLRLMPGALMQLSNKRFGFGIDALVGCAFLLAHERLLVLTEGGYTFETFGPDHLASMGVVVAGGPGIFQAGVDARWILGASNGHFATGGQAGVYLGILGSIIPIEFSWQGLNDGTNAFRAEVGVNVTFLIAYILIKELIDDIAGGVSARFGL